MLTVSASRWLELRARKDGLTLGLLLGRFARVWISSPARGIGA